MLEVILIFVCLFLGWLAYEVRLLRRVYERRMTMLVLLLPSTSVAQTPQAEVIAAYNDSLKLPPDVARQTRYQTLYNIPAKDRAVFLKVHAIVVNGLSREAELIAPRLVTPTLVALCCDDYGWELTTYGALHAKEPYFHVKLRQGKEETTALAPWLPTKEIAHLAKVTSSIVPIVRADWFLHEVCQAETYYSFLGLKKLSDLEALVGLDRKLMEKHRKDLAAIVDESTVAINSRLIYRYSTQMGYYWETHDNALATGKANPTRNLDKDHTFAAREIYATLPNGLDAVALADNKDGLINEAPPDVASDRGSPTPDSRIRPPLCAACHAGTLQPINDYARRTFGRGADFALGIPYDRDRAKRLRSLYLGPLQEELAGDKAKYASTLKRFVALTPAEYGKGFSAAFYGYEASLSADDYAREFGLTKQILVAQLKAYLVRPTVAKEHVVNVTDIGLAPYIAGSPVRRSHHEEMMPLLGQILGAKQ
jgi:hypothetical protein